MSELDRKLDLKYLASGPAPLGRIFNYLRRIEDRDFSTVRRGPRSTSNLDAWTVNLMVGLGLVEERGANRNPTLTSAGEKISSLLPPATAFPEDARTATLRSLRHRLNRHPELYWALKTQFLGSAPVRNLAIFLRESGKREMGKREVYEQLGRAYGLDRAHFNRIPSTVQIAEFCDVVETRGSDLRVCDPYYIAEHAILSDAEFVHREIEKRRPRQDRGADPDRDFAQMLLDHVGLPESPQRRKEVVTRYRRSLRIARRLKRHYGGHCQVCQSTFRTRSGQNYCEAHHLKPLSADGADAPENIVVLCATCHAKLHYAPCNLLPRRGATMEVDVNGERLVISFSEAHLQLLHGSGGAARKRASHPTR